MFNNKSAQISGTLTWVVATVVIIIVLTLTIYISSGSNLAQQVLDLQGKIATQKATDLTVQKSFLSYLLTKDSQDKIIYNKLGDREDRKFDTFSGELAQKVFLEYEKENIYDKVWLGKNDNSFFENLEDYFYNNDYFGSKPLGVRYSLSGHLQGMVMTVVIPSTEGTPLAILLTFKKTKQIINTIKLNNNQYFEMILENE